jgi:iron complex transport system substrate-binding protein
MLRLAGGENVFADVAAESRVVTLREVQTLQPDAVILCWCGARKTPPPRLLAERSGWDVLGAVRNGRLFPLLEPEFGRPGPRLAEGVETLARLLHPGAVPPA